MSSHHFVKEGQEPALIIADAGDSGHIGALLEWAPFVIVFENALDMIHRLGIKADVIFANPDSVETLKTDLAYQMPVTILSSESADMFQKALQFLIESNQKFVHVCSPCAEDYLAQASGFVKQLEITCFSDSIKWSSVVSGRFEKWLPSGSSVLIKANAAFFADGHVKPTENRVDILADCLMTIRSEAPFWVGELIH